MSAQIKPAPTRRGRTPKTEKPSRPTLTEASPTPALLRASISDEEMVAIFRMLVEKARGGDVGAAKLVLNYKLGKPAAAPNPDEIDRDEWEHYQRDTINLQEVQQVLGSLRTRVCNDIARTALPVVTQARQEALASQLVANLPDARKATKDSGVATEHPQEGTPIPNRYSSSVNDAFGVQSTSRDQASTIHDQPSTTNEAPPIPNRKSKLRQKGKTKPKKVKPEWLRQTARRIQKNGPANEVGPAKRVRLKGG